MKKTPTSLKVLLFLSWSWFCIVTLVAGTVIVPSLMQSRYEANLFIIGLLSFFVMLQFLTAFFLCKRKTYAPFVAFLSAVLFMTVLFMAKLPVGLAGLTVNVAMVLLILFNWKHFLVPSRALNST